MVVMNTYSSIHRSMQASHWFRYQREKAYAALFVVDSEPLDVGQTGSPQFGTHIFYLSARFPISLFLIFSMENYGILIFVGPMA